MDRITEEFEVDWNGKKENIVIQRLTWKERRTVRKACRSMNIINNVPHEKIDEDKYSLMMIRMCVIDAPFDPKDENAINNHPDGTVIDYILQRVEKFNTPDEGKKNQAPERDKAEEDEPA